MTTIKLSKKFSQKHLRHKHYFTMLNSGAYNIDNKYAYNKAYGDKYDENLITNAGYACKYADNLSYVFTNMDSAKLNPHITNYKSYVSYCFANNLPVALRADLFYFDIIHEILEIVGSSDNIETFRKLYNGLDNGEKIKIDYQYNLCKGFHPIEFAEYTKKRIQDHVNFDATSLTNMAFDEDSTIAFTALSMYGGKAYFEYFITGNVGCQGPYIPDDYMVDGFKSIHILDDVEQYSKLLDNMSKLNDIFGSYNPLKNILSRTTKFVKKLHDAITNHKNEDSKEFLANLPLEMSAASTSVLVDLRMAEIYAGCEIDDDDYRYHKMAAGIFTTEPSNDVKDLSIPTYGFIMWEDPTVKDTNKNVPSCTIKQQILSI